ncbi:MAG: glycerol-3-phosphate 1-O-acyltransferase PlsY [Rhodospirillales bacterium]|nr:glycerol-3-phosphate 1-O-acyltransferase PlsY [Rhodospirillales bacterium]
MQLVFFFLAYLIGSIPFGLLLTRIAGLGDIRQIGSGNIGATNVLRTGNKKLAALTLLLDGGKGAAVVLLYSALYPYTPSQDSAPPGLFIATYLLIGFLAILGHNFPVWLKFRGGKGVATTLGVLLAAVPWAGVAACLVWLTTAFISRISSLSALVALAIAPVVTFFVYGAEPAGICLLITALGYTRHKDNIKRLLKGEEPKIGKKKDAPATNE